MFKKLVISKLSSACWGNRPISAGLPVQPDQQSVAAGWETLRIALRKSLRGLTRALIAMIVLSTSLFGTVHGAGLGLVPLPPQKTAQAASETVTNASSGQFLAAGISDSCAINSGDYYGLPGFLYCWGNMFKYSGYYDFRPLPMDIFYGPDGYPSGGVTAVAAGNGHNCAVKDGALYCWGRNNYGQLGDGTTINRYQPVLVQNMDSGVTAVAVGGEHTCAIKGGAVYCWGRNYNGQLGNGTNDNSSAPVAVNYMGSGVTAIDAGYGHTCAIKGGALYCWGSNAAGALGDGTALNRSEPVAVQNMNGGVTAVSAGDSTSCAVKNGALYCWGENWYGQVGNGTTLPWRQGVRTPVQVIGMGSNVTAVSTGMAHTCAIKSGAVYCWGINSGGQLGNGTTTNSSTPVQVVGLDNGMVAVAVADGVSSFYEPTAHTLALAGDGCLYAWGRNGDGQLGVSTYVTRALTPVLVSSATVPSGQCSWSGPGSASFRKSEPQNDAIGQPSSGLYLRWRSHADANHYRYCVSAAPGCVPTVSTGSDRRVTLNLNPGVYYWQARACLNSDCSSFVDANNGEHWSFSVSPYWAEIARSRNEIPANPIQSYAKLTVTLRTWDGQPAIGVPVRLDTSRPSADMLAPALGTTNRMGQFALSIASSEPGTVVISLTSSLYPGMVLTRTTMRFTQTVSSTLSADPHYTLVSTDVHSSTLRLRLIDSDGLPAANKSVAFFSSRSEDTIMPAVAQTNSGGEAAVQIRSMLSGTAVITVHNVSDNVAIPVSTSVVFIPTGTRSVVANVIAIPDTITIGMTTTLQAFVREPASGMYYLSYPVYFSAEQGTGSLTPVDRYPATAWFQPSISGVVVLTAMDSLSGMPLGHTEVTVVSDCPRRPVIQEFVPSYQLGPDISYPQLHGADPFDIQLKADVTVDWRGCQPGRIEFALSNGKQISVSVSNGQTETVKKHYSLSSFYLNKDLPIGLGQLSVVARTKGGIPSDPYEMTTQASEVPWPMIMALGAIDSMMGLKELPNLGNVSLWKDRVKFNGKDYNFDLKFPKEPWKISPLDIFKNKADENGKKLVENHTTSINLSTSFKLWLLCSKPPEADLNLSIDPKKFDLGKRAWLSGLSGSVSAKLNLKLGHNPLCHLFVRPNEDFSRPDATGSFSIDAKVSKKFQKPLVDYLLRFSVPALALYQAFCNYDDLMTWLRGNPGIDPSNGCDALLGQIFGNVTLEPSIGVGLNTGLELSQRRLYLTDLTGNFNPSVKLMYDIAWPADLLKASAEASADLKATFALRQKARLEELMPISEVVVKAGAKFQITVLNIRWLTYANEWSSGDIKLPPSSQSLNAALSSPESFASAPGAMSIRSGLIPPATATPDYSGFGATMSSQLFGRLQFKTAQSTATASSIVTTVLASGQLTYSTVSLAHHPYTQRMMLVWTQDDPDKPIGSSREIFYSLWNGVNWSSPGAVTSNALHDLAPQVGWLSSDKAIVVWEQFKVPLDPQNTSAAQLDQLEIAYAIYDAGTDRWSAPQILTNDSNMDHGVALSRDASGRVMAAWKTRSVNNSAIQTALFNADGQLVRRDTVMQGPASVSEPSVVISGNNAAVAFTRLVSPSAIATPTLRVFITHWNPSTGVWTEPVAQPAELVEQSDTHPALAYDNAGQLWLMFQRTGLVERSGGDGYDRINQLMLDNLSDDNPAFELHRDERRVSDVRLMNTNRGLLALLRVQDFGRTDLYAILADAGASNWSRPIRLTDDLAFESSLDTQVGSAGELLAAYIRTNYQLVTETVEISGEVLTTTKRQPIGTDLVALSRVFSTLPDAAISSEGITVTFENDKPLPGTTALVSVTVANRGDALASPFSVKLYAGNPSAGGQLISETQISLAAGFTQTLEFVWSVPAVDMIDLYVVLDENNSLTEADETNNAASISVLGQELALIEVSAYVEDSFVRVDSLFSSIGSTATVPAALTITLSLSDGVTLIEEYFDEIPSIEPGDLFTHHTDLFVGYLQPGTYAVTVAAETLKGEARVETVVELLPNLAFESESLDVTDLTVPFIRVEGVVRNTSQFGVTDVLVAVFDPARTVATGLVATTTIPFIGPYETVPVSLIVPEAMPCGLSVWVNPYGLPGAFAEQRLSDNFLYKSGSERMCTRAGYEVNRRSGVAPLTVVFTGTLTPNTTSWEWDFGDGVAGPLSGTGVQGFTQVVSHTYTQPGVYTVTLRATSPYTSTFWQEPMTVRVYAQAAADFESGNRSVLVGEVVSFTNRSTGDIGNYSWDFGDGETSSSYEPLHVYERPGRYTVTLTVGGAGGTDTITKTEYIAVYATRAYFPLVVRR